jgi:hypothetical protein
VGQDDGHHPFVFQEVEAVQQKGEVSGGLGREAVVLKAYVVALRNAIERLELLASDATDTPN